MATIVVPTGTIAKKYWIETVPLGSASNFQTSLTYCWLHCDCTIFTGTGGGEAPRR